MDKLIRKGIVDILTKHKELLQIPLRQRAKFEGWLKFELACYLDQIGMASVEVESQSSFRHKTDIVFIKDDYLYSVELKTPNTSWKIPGVNSSGRPITKNIQSIVNDAFKLNSQYGIVAFVLFPIPVDDNRWEVYLKRISEKTGLSLSKDNNCDVIKMNVGDKRKCDLIVCSFMCKQFRKWR
jgi:hypothetical protein